MILHTYQWGLKDLNTPKILFLHGLGGTGKIWRPLAVSLEKYFNILSPDQRAHGQSRTAKSYTPLDHGKDLEDTLEEHQHMPTWILAHSMGVRSAIGFTQHRPEWIKGMILVDIGFSGDAGGSIGTKLAPVLKEIPLEFNKREEAREWLQAKMPDSSITQYLLAVSLPHPTIEGGIRFPFDREGLLQTIRSSLNFDARPWLKKFAETGKPVYILRGKESQVWSQKSYQKESEEFKNYPNIIFQEWEGTGHGLPFERRKELATAILKWAKK